LIDINSEILSHSEACEITPHDAGRKRYYKNTGRMGAEVADKQQ